MRIRKTQIKINDLFRIDLWILRNNIDQSFIVFIENLSSFFQSMLKLILINFWAQDRSQFRFSIGFKFVSLWLQVNSQIGNFNKRSVWSPKFGSKLVTILVNDFTSKIEISIEPSVPKSSSISHNIALSQRFKSSFWNRCNFETWTISVSSNNFEPWVKVYLPVLEGSKLSPTWKATNVELFLVKKYLLPFFNSQLAVSESSVNPLLVKSCLHHSTTWKGEGVAFTNSKNLSARVLLLLRSYPDMRNQKIIKIRLITLFIIIKNSA